MKKSNISVVINTKNAASTLEATLKSVSGWAAEIIVVDMKSKDKTTTIAQKYTKKIFTHDDVGYVEPARNFAVSKAKNDWLLVLDADEVIPNQLASKLIALSKKKQSDVVCYYLARKNIIFNNWIQKSGWWPDYQARFFKKGFVKWTDTIHQQPTINGNTEHLPASEELAVEHQNYLTINHFLEKMMNYTTITSKEKPVEANFSKNIFKAFHEEFLKRLFAEEGYKEGTHGLSLALLQSCYQAVVEMKVWQQTDFKPSKQDTLKYIEEFHKDFSYWLAEEKSKQSSGFARYYWLLRKKLRI